MKAVFKDIARAAVADDPLDYVMSDGVPDRFGDVVDPAGWDLKNFKSNPIALFGHNRDFPIGSWMNVKVDKGQLQGRLKLLDRGASVRHDEIRSLVEAGVLRAVSVGFRPLEAEPLNPKDPYGPQKFTKSELVECSLVSIPANPNALQISRQFSLSAETQSLLFGEPAEIETGQGGKSGESARAKSTSIPAGESADPKLRTKGDLAMSFAEKITAAQTQANTLRDQLATLSAGENVDAAAIDTMSGQLEAQQATLAALQRAEKLMGHESTPVIARAAPAASASDPRGAVPVSGKVYAAVDTAKAKRPADLIFRSVICQLCSHLTRGDNAPKTPLDILRERYGEDDEIKTVMDVINRAASAPATTTTSGWAAQLCATAVADFLDLLYPLSVYPSLASRGPRFSFGRNGTINIPSRVSTPTIAGGFVAEGAPIPVKQGAFTSIPITPRKMGVISTFTREISLYSTPSIEALIRGMILEDTAVAIDTVLLGNGASTTTTPAGLRAGVSGQTPTAGGGFNALVGDLKLLIGVLVAANSLRQPVWIMNPAQALSVGLTQNAGGDFPFQAEVNGGRLMGYPLILSTTQAATMVTLVDAADFFSATSDSPVFNVSDTATLHMEDTNPVAIGTTGAPNVVAAPARSLFQTDSIGIRMTMDINWILRRSGVVAWVTAVTW
jgi:HK97 family phage major capsid protein/HK97 family phage prohead protease